MLHATDFVLFILFSHTFFLHVLAHLPYLCIRGFDFLDFLEQKRKLAMSSPLSENKKLIK
jgi:hypothetical protein